MKNQVDYKALGEFFYYDDLDLEFDIWDGTNRKIYLNSEVKKVKQILNKILPRVTDDITKIKLTEAIKQADSIKKGKIVKDKQVVSLMRYYELIKELHNVTA